MADAVTYDVLGVPISVTNPAEAASRIECWSRDDEGRFICARDVASLMTIIDDPQLACIHKDAAMIAPDGMPLAIIGRLQGLAVERTCGADLIDLVCARSPLSGLSHYFYGGRAGVAEKLARSLSQRYPGLQVAGWECPPFRALTAMEEDEMVARIRASGADVVWVGLSSPIQEVWMHRHFRHLPQTLIGVGAAFDFQSGTIRRAPKWMQRWGLEWSYRLASEPRRLWKRYLVQAPRFVFRILRQRIMRKLPGRTA